jgi:hypothetical protein
MLHPTAFLVALSLGLGAVYVALAPRSVLFRLPEPGDGGVALPGPQGGCWRYTATPVACGPDAEPIA